MPDIGVGTRNTEAESTFPAVKKLSFISVFILSDKILLELVLHLCVCVYMYTGIMNSLVYDL